MDFLNKPFSDIDEQDLQQLISLATPEIGSIEYKSKLPGATDNDKKEFLADVSSFANGSGGFIIYGMDEKKGIPIKLNGLSGLDMDSEILRLENLIRSGIAPRIPGFHIRPITLANNSHAVIIKILKSWISPHMVIFNGTSRFFSRGSAGKYPLDVNQLRNAFLATDSMSNRLKEFRIDRINKVILGDTPLPLPAGAKIILHLLPINTFLSPNAINLKHAVDNFHTLSILYTKDNFSPWDFRVNLDGLVTNIAFKDHSIPSYTQLFRNGAIEAVDNFLLEKREEEDAKIIQSIAFEQAIIDTTTSFLTFLATADVDPPIAIFLTLTGVNGYRIGISQNMSWQYRRSPLNRTIDREVIQAPEIVIENYEGNNIGKILRPMFDAIWNSAGWVGSLNYDAEGNWIARR